ncbi:MAG: methylated-DNA--[protein]-cysteine S-methyltransferase [Smithella sp.]|nr:methylated-DNA--[protein]-cysteine S-methyltransferase [Smithella sp.]
MKTPFGSVGVIWSLSKDNPRIIHVLLSTPEWTAEAQALKLFPDAGKSSCAEIDAVASSIKAYLEGDHVKFSLGLVDLLSFSQFQQSVLLAQHAIPRGSVSTYGLIATHVGAPGAARAVGNVMAANPFPLIIPCHRTILSNFDLGGFQSGSEKKRALLNKEGVVFDESGRLKRGKLHYNK